MQIGTYETQLLHATAAELLALALTELFPQIQLLDGGPLDYGFYYDFVHPQPIHGSILELIEQRMHGLVRKNPQIKILHMMRENAFDFLNHHRQPLRARLAVEQADNILNLIQIGSFVDLLQSETLDSLEEIKAIKLLEAREIPSSFPAESSMGIKMRLVGTAFSETYYLKQFLKAFEKLKKIDHRVLGPQLELLHFSKRTDSDCFWLSKGNFLIEELIRFWNKQEFHRISSPNVPDKLAEHLQLFGEKGGELPCRYGEIFSINEKVSEVHRWGLFRKEFYLSDLITIFCTSEQVNKELIYSLQFIEEIIKIFGFEARWYLSEEKENSPSRDKRGSKWLKEALEQLNIEYVIRSLTHEPQLTVCFRDSLGREWAGPQIRIISSLKVSEKPLPIIITKRLFGSFDRFVGLLTEHYKGYFPLWLAPEQIRILVIGEKNRSYADNVCNQCRQAGWRVQVDSTEEKLGAKIHTAEKERIPYLVIIGDQETSKGKINVRFSNEKVQTNLLKVDEFLSELQQKKWAAETVDKPSLRSKEQLESK